MQYQIFYTKRAERDLAKLDSQIKKRLDKAIKRMSNNPHIYSEHLTDTRLVPNGTNPCFFWQDISVC